MSGALAVGTTTSHERFTLDGAAYLAAITAPSVTTNRLYNTGGDLYWAGSLVGGSTVGTWTTNGTDVWRPAGSVGIGTSSPFATLSVDGSTFIDGTLTATGALALTSLANGLLTVDASGAVTASSTIASSFIEDAYLRNTGDSLSGNLTLSGSAANIALGSNWLSGDGDDEGILISSEGKVSIGTTSPTWGNIQMYLSTERQYGTYLNQVSDGAGSIYGQTAYVTVPSTKNDSVTYIQGGAFYSDNYSTGNVIIQTGLNGYAYHNGPGSATYLMGLRAYAATYGGTVDSVRGISVDVGVYGGTAVNSYGIYIDDVTYGGQINQAYGLYQADTNARNYFGGNTGVGSTSPSAKLTVQNTGSGNSFIVEDQANDTTPFVVGPSGNVGIGNSSPAFPLHFSASDGTKIVLGQNQYGIGVNQAGPNYSLDIFSNRSVGFRASSVSGSIGSLINVDGLGNSYFNASGGNVGIGSTNPSTFKLEVAGNIGPSADDTYNLGAAGRDFGCLYYNSGTLGTCASDERLKTDIEALSFADGEDNGALAKLARLELKQFEYKNAPGSQYHGLIAQDVEDFAPELVVDGSDGFKAIRYGDIQWLVIEAVQELWAKVEELFANDNRQDDLLETQQNEIDQLKDRLRKLEAAQNIPSPTPTSPEPETEPESESPAVDEPGTVEEPASEPEPVPEVTEPEPVL